MGEYSEEDRVADAIRAALREMQEAKPGDRSEIDRRYAIAITEMEKALAYYEYWIGRDSSG
ncbi:MAG: hypothetical protein WBO46_15035 [Caldilineaceae bacterium]